MLLAFVALAAPARAQVLPSPWRSTDIGSPPAAGSADEINGTFTIQASGADIWGISDQFHFVYQQVTGDVEIVARVDSVLDRHGWSKAGVMIRSALSPSAAHGYALVSATKGLAFQRRRADGGSSSHTSAGTGLAPKWTRLVRKGTTVSAYVSQDGTTWTSAGTDTIALGAAAYVGIAVTSHASALTSADVSQVAVSPLGLPAGFATQDIGVTGAQGSASHRAGSFYVSGAGADIWDTQDQFRFVYTQVNGDVDVRARVASLEYLRAWTKAGVMIRETLSGSSRHVMAVVSAGKGYAFQRRAETGGLSASTAGGSGQAPGWVRIVRAGTRVEAYRSADGTAWQLIGTATTTMGAAAYVGLVVSSHQTGALADAIFDNVSVTGGASTNARPSASLTAPASGTTLTLPVSTTVAATASDMDGTVTRVDFLANNSLIGSDTTSPYSVTWTPASGGSYALTVIAYDNGGASTESAPATVTVTAAANQPPTVSLTAPANGASYTAPASVTVSANASDPEGALTRVDFYANGAVIGSDSTAPYSISWANVGAGTYSVTAVARDGAGNSTTSGAMSVSVATTSTGTWAVAFTASADHATVTRYVLQIFANGADPATATPIATSDLGKPVPDAGNNISLDRTAFFNGLAVGTYRATVGAESSGGVSRSTSVTFTR